MPYTIRPATTDDAAAFLDLRNALHAETTFMLFEPDEFKSTVEQQAAFIEGIRNDAGSLILVSEAESGELAGMLTAWGGGVNRRRHSTHIALGVRREHWSRGVATGMLEECIAWSERLGLVRVGLTVHATNHRAVALYMRLGFVVEGMRRASLLVDGVLVDEYMMSRIAAGEANPE